MYQIIGYSCAIILLPIIPAYILYTAIPLKATNTDDSVEGKYQGLNIKLKGAFAGYFVLVLLLTAFIGARLRSESTYEYWTVEGVVDTATAGDPKLITFTIEPPDQQKYADGRFVIKDVPIRKCSNRSSTLVLAKMSDGKRIEEVVNLEEKHKILKNKYEISFKKDNLIYINTPIVFSSTGNINGNAAEYSVNNAYTPQPVGK